MAVFKEFTVNFLRMRAPPSPTHKTSTPQIRRTCATQINRELYKHGNLPLTERFQSFLTDFVHDCGLGRERRGEETGGRDRPPPPPPPPPPVWGRAAAGHNPGGGGAPEPRSGEAYLTPTGPARRHGLSRLPVATGLTPSAGHRAALRRAGPGLSGRPRTRSRPQCLGGSAGRMEGGEGGGGRAGPPPSCPAAGAPRRPTAAPRPSPAPGRAERPLTLSAAPRRPARARPAAVMSSHPAASGRPPAAATTTTAPLVSLQPPPPHTHTRRGPAPRAAHAPPCRRRHCPHLARSFPAWCWGGGGGGGWGGRGASASDRGLERGPEPRTGGTCGSPARVRPPVAWGCRVSPVRKPWGAVSSALPGWRDRWGDGGQSLSGERFPRR